MRFPPLISADFYAGDPERKKKFVVKLGAAYNNIGFVAIRNHFLTKEMQDRLYSAIKKYFALPDDLKKKYEISGLQDNGATPVKAKSMRKVETLAT